MKTILHSVLLVTVTLTVMAFSARADLTTGTDPAFGANSLTIDTQTGLGWLNLGYTDGLSYNEVRADMQPGGLFSNYTFATAQQVDNLYTDAGLEGTGYYYLAAPAIGSLISLVGSTETVDGAPGFIAVSGTSTGPGSVAAPGIYATGINGNEFYEVSDGVSLGTDYGDSFSTPGLSDWLVTAVPEPGTGSFAIAGFAAVLFARRWKTRANKLAVRADA